ncbi:MAG: ribbon-helix-helix domain-containing protein [Bacteroidetes bacterium]|nr:ribbon-helix-helix domain-containing protein [Bacteroidota bacterium]MBU1485005.1 ribbon-helix-helix domain-containing protein [Bacteroidota bacterium]MBU2046488.1 ribbon-helix-helix domain-containing protein [Bacteroidota bacterium]MBU2269292.1 ribbon-helix-helix domain-containing protein [Bacteroidota bacterium]MBU2374852.1 ribbon-helix-helix domain-containing protein [Bacteroidota bacterium]
MTTFTSTLPDDLMDLLTEMAAKLKLPKNRLIEKALRIYLDQLNKAEYMKSYKTSVDDKDILIIAEEGMEDYFKQIDIEAR